MGKTFALVTGLLLLTALAFAQGRRCTADYECTVAGEFCVEGRCRWPAKAAEPDPLSGLPSRDDEAPEEGVLTTDEITEGFQRRVDAGRAPARQPESRKVQAVVKDGRVMLREIATGKAFSVAESEVREALRGGEFRLETPEEWNQRYDEKEAAAQRSAPSDGPAKVPYEQAARERREVNPTAAMVGGAFGVVLGYMLVAFIARRFMAPTRAALVAMVFFATMPFIVGYEPALLTAGMAVGCFVVHLMFLRPRKPEAT